ncbi:CopY family transcriptional regulator [Tyzzerella sp. An114]|uniref:BlaI/MecI/CopY family transcriptional regulator n=1 Tax=Tyzzerella sp. An114 TaxID=1965545 RepID=UPI000B437644|nr:BlaI/MecI/CopY family transcriptional regulator [Tyzzerella sp. An114]OUQ59151.1 CopY family transcriptional regulator [Tyzzerella sp. An114]
MNKITRLPDTELEIMKVIWTMEKNINTTEIKKILEKNRPWNVSALQTLLNRLIDRGFLDTYKEGKNKCYTVLVTEDEYISFENKSFFKKVNNSSITKLVASLYNSKSISEDDLLELSKFIEDKTRGDKHD